MIFKWETEYQDQIKLIEGDLVFICAAYRTRLGGSFKYRLYSGNKSTATGGYQWIADFDNLDELEEFIVPDIYNERKRVNEYLADEILQELNRGSVR